MLGCFETLSPSLPGIAAIARSGHELITTTASDCYTQNI